MIKCDSIIKMNMQAINALIEAQTTALEQTAEVLHTDVVQAQVIPRRTGNLQNESMFRDTSRLEEGIVSIVHSAPYARRLYFHPEYNFNRKSWDERVYGKRGRFAKNGREYKGKIKRHDANRNAKGKWFEDWIESPDGTGKYTEQIKKAYADIYKRITGV